MSSGYHVEVTAAKISELVKLGNYGWANSSINDSNFKASEAYRTEVFLRHFCQNMSTSAVFEALDAEGLRAATMSELLEFGILYPELQRQFPIVALGSVWEFTQGNSLVGCLFSDAYERQLNLSWFGFAWDDFCRFAATRK